MKILAITISFGLSFISFSSFAQKDTTDQGFSIQTPVAIKILEARHEFSDNNMRGALTLFRDALETDPKSANATYGIAECYYNLKRYSLALEYLDKAVALNASVNSATDFFYGQIYHRVADLDKAIQYYQKFLDEAKGRSFDREMATMYVEQCRYAKEMMKNPVPVQITNMGEAINTRFEDYTPCITADGKMLVFTSRRSDTKGGAIDTNGDYKFFEDIYFSTYNESTGEWSDSDQLPGDVNTDTYDAVLSVFPDGSGIYVYKNSGTSAGDIFVSKKSSGENKFYAAEKMPRPINTSYFESSISMTEDGKTVYFISERPEGLGQTDIYVSHKTSKGWSSPENLGKIVNTEWDEKFVYIHPNGKTLYFASNGHKCLGSYDIFKTELVNGQWSVPVNLGYPINTVNEESTFSLTSDNSKMFISAEYGDSFGERDIYLIDVSNYDLISKGYDVSTFGNVKCVVTDAKNQALKGARVSVFDPVTNNLLNQGKTDKLGNYSVSLLGGMVYKFVIQEGDKHETREVMVDPVNTGETQITIEVKI